LRGIFVLLMGRIVIMKVYHGCDMRIEEIGLEKCKYGKNFGCGFYLIDTKERNV
jgi:hypothetical protein